MKTIVFLIDGLLNSGGTERLTVLTANNLALSGYNIHIITLRESSKYFFKVNHTVNVSSLAFCKKRNYFLTKILYIKEIRGYLKEISADCIVAVDSLLSVYSIPASMGLKTYHITWEQFNFDINLGMRLRDVSRFLSSFFSSKIIVLTNRDKLKWLKKYHWSSNKIHVIFNPSFINVTDKKYSDDSKIILAVGRLAYQKGFDLLIKNWAEICNDYQGWKLRIIGSGNDELYLKELAKTLDVDEKVEFAGQISNISDEYNKASFFCMSSRFEGIGLVLIEAQACGLPLIAYDCDCGPSEVIKNSENGYLIPAFNDAAYKNAMRKMIENPSLRQQFSKECKHNADVFSTESFCQAWIQLIQKISE